MSLLDKLPSAKLQMVSKACGDPTTIDTNTLPNSLKDPKQADMFIDLLVDESRLLSAVDTRPVNDCSGKVHLLDLCSVVTEGACTTSKPTGHLPEEYVRSWQVEKYRSHMKLSSDFLECNIEGQAAREVLLNQFLKRMRMDMEDAAILSDDTLKTGDNMPAVNNLLGVNDGWRKILNECVPDCQIVDAGCQAPSRFLYYTMKTRIPNRYRSMESEYVWIVPPIAADNWVLEASFRETPSGDAAIYQGTSQAGPWGRPFFTVPRMPADLPADCGNGTVDSFEIWYTPLDNLVVYILRDMKFEYKRVPENDGWEVYCHYKVDFEVRNPDVPVIAKNVSMCGAPYADCGDCTAVPCPSC